MAKDKKQKEDNGVAGKIISLMFLLILAGGIYFMVNLFKSIPVNEVNISGQWKMNGTPTRYLTINVDGTASSYEEYTVGEAINKATYTYTLTKKDSADNDNVYILALKNTKTREIEEIKVTGVSRAQISVIQNGSHFDTFTKINIF